MRWNSKYNISIIIVLSFVSRLPLLLSENLYLDGDECIVGLMAKHFLEGKEVPVFFYGQSYGFSLLEVIPISAAFYLFGISTVSLKIGILALWITGVVFFYKSLAEIGFAKNRWAPLLITLLLILIPSFGFWSMKARGGYITAFTITSMVMYFMFKEKWKYQRLTDSLIGLMIVIIYQSQALWLVGLLPILVFLTIKRRNISSAVFLIAGILAGAAIFYLLKINLSDFWSPGVISLSNLSPETIYSIPKQIYYNITGSYLYTQVIKASLITNSMAFLFTSITLLTLAVAVAFALKKKPFSPLFYVAAIAVLLNISYLAFMPSNTYRYLLPLSGYALLMIYLLIINIEYQRAVNIAIIIIVFFCAISMYSLKDIRFEDSSNKMSLISSLQERGVKHIYCEGGLLQWELMFLSNESIIARFRSSTDRYPSYISQVDAALENTSKKTALVGYYNQQFVATLDKHIPIDNAYYIYENPSKSLLIQRGFNFNKTDHNE